MEMRGRYPERPKIINSVKVPEWVSLGENVSIHAGVCLGSQGFGFERDEEGLPLHIPHIGQLVIEDDVEIFEGTNICRGTIAETRICRGTKIDALCHIGHNAIVGKNCIITAHCVIGGSCRIGDGVYIGLNSTIKNKVEIADGVFVGQGSNVIEDILDPDTVWIGNPARFLRKLRD